MYIYLWRIYGSANEKKNEVCNIPSCMYAKNSNIWTLCSEIMKENVLSNLRIYEFYVVYARTLLEYAL